MANNTINGGAYSLATGIDPVADVLLIQQGSLYHTINRNVLLGVTGTPADISSTQSLSNKTIGNTNSITVKDGSLVLQNSSSTTKQAQFSLASITAGNTRTFTLPDYSATLATIAGTETLTNKTLTSPTINSPNITNASITADSLSGYTSANNGTMYGIAVSSSQFSASALTNGTITATKIGTDSSWSWATWTPTWTNVVVTNSTVTTKFIQVGKTVFYRVTVVFAGGDVPSGSINFTLPVTSASYPGTSTLPDIGTGAIFITNGYPARVVWVNTTTASIRVSNVASTYPIDTALSATVPNTFTNGSEIHLHGFYEAA